MPRKNWEARTEVTPELIRFREKRKWQIALRRYVIERNPSPFYAPYFGLDIEKLRQWFEVQFLDGLTWGDFGKKWQFDHIIPVAYFDFTSRFELKLCWNFTNLRLSIPHIAKDRGNWLDILTAKSYFQKLYKHTGYPICQNLLSKIEQLELSESLNTEAQQAFIHRHQDFLAKIHDYSAFEFELLNRGRSLEEVKKESELFKKHAR